MKITPPRAALTAARAIVADIAQRRRPSVPVLATASAGALAIAAWHRVFTLGLNARKSRANRYCFLGWRCLILGEQGRVLASVAVRRLGAGGYAVSSVSEGLLVSGTVDALILAERGLGVGLFEPIFLRVPATARYAIWLRTARRRGADPVIALPPSGAADNRLKIVSMDSFRAAQLPPRARRSRIMRPAGVV